MEDNDKFSFQREHTYNLSFAIQATFKKLQKTTKNTNIILSSFGHHKISCACEEKRRGNFL